MMDKGQSRNKVVIEDGSFERVVMQVHDGDNTQKCVLISEATSHTEARPSVCSNILLEDEDFTGAVQL